MTDVAREAATGSSPLARGLLREEAGGDAPVRIIPARAGFTTPISRPRGTFWDHPRSRGVYPGPRPPGRQGLGSSPLARGLPGLPRLDVVGGGIIPARAGFTSTPPGGGAWPTGSSPLARGLHEGDLLAGADLGIIPARAGFTRGRSAGRRGPWDHPRSRGVYAAADAEHRLREGSSPLARGLLHSGPIAAGQVRIIPARAGFTLLQEDRGAGAPDHPRSRGVYACLGFSSLESVGSSPLARGLPSRNDAADG